MAPVVEGVGPDGEPGEGGRDRGVVHKELVGHHLELTVSTHTKVRGPQTWGMVLILDGNLEQVAQV